MNTFFDFIKSRGIEITENEPLKNHTTFRIGGNATYFVSPSSEEEIVCVLRAAEDFSVRTLVLGNGSNMLISDKGFDGAVIYIGEKMSDIEIDGENTIKAQAGALLVRVCRFALENSLGNMEKLFGIPGSVGGCLYMNAGAYGGEMKDVVVSARCVDRSGDIKTIPLEEMSLSYRHSIFSEKGYIVTSVTFKLEKSDKNIIESEMDLYMQKRKDKQPLEYPSAGSVFKRPEGYFAGALIEECGLKGMTIGGAQVSDKHAGFIINTGSATQKDVSSLIEFCKKTVFEEKGVMLEEEIKIFE